ncbi:involucrin-like [Solenopsis invicta]|uniref:involucrin-like n=1 Tax=Solenopsis invicta TaxID=13686 RepID=UPI00193CECF9|nr:involucrin-like [Solenopsis invicta]
MQLVRHVARVEPLPPRRAAPLERNYGARRRRAEEELQGAVAARRPRIEIADLVAEPPSPRYTPVGESSDEDEEEEEEEAEDQEEEENEIEEEEEEEQEAMEDEEEGDEEESDEGGEVEDNEEEAEIENDAEEREVRVASPEYDVQTGAGLAEAVIGRNASGEEFLHNTAENVADQRPQQQQHRSQQPQSQHSQQQEQDPQSQQQQSQQQQHRVGDRFNYIELQTENARRFRNFAILGREASFAIRPVPQVPIPVEAEDPGEGTSAAAIREEAQRNANDLEGENDNEVKGAVAFVFYDFETRQDETYEGTENVKLHVPTLCVAQQICAACVAIDDMTVRCRWCGTREFVFNIDPVKQFIEFVTRPTKHFKSIICIAHNAKAFDAQFILKYLVEKSLITEKPRIILNGTKIIVMTIGHTKFIDSVNYMPMRLSDLPKAFGLRDTADKGIFPHLFNTVENQSYVGPLPET